MFQLNHMGDGGGELHLTDSQLAVFKAAKEAEFSDMKKAWASFTENTSSSVQWQDQLGMTPLHYACQKNDVDCVKFLIEVAGFLANDVDAGTYTALHWAAMKNRDGVILFLLRSKHADPSIKTMYSETAYEVALRMHKTEAIQAFKDCGIATDQTISTKLTEVKEKQATDIIRFLHALGLEQYVEKFTQEAIDLDMIRDGLISDTDLQSIGVSALGHRRKILSEAAKLVKDP